MFKGYPCRKADGPCLPVTPPPPSAVSVLRDYAENAVNTSPTQWWIRAWQTPVHVCTLPLHTLASRLSVSTHPRTTPTHPRTIPDPPSNNSRPAPPSDNSDTTHPRTTRTTRPGHSRPRVCIGHEGSGLKKNGAAPGGQAPGETALATALSCTPVEAHGALCHEERFDHPWQRGGLLGQRCRQHDPETPADGCAAPRQVDGRVVVHRSTEARERGRLKVPRVLVTERGRPAGFERPFGRHQHLLVLLLLRALRREYCERLAPSRLGETPELDVVQRPSRHRIDTRVCVLKVGAQCPWVVRDWDMAVRRHQNKGARACAEALQREWVAFVGRAQPRRAPHSALQKQHSRMPRSGPRPGAHGRSEGRGCAALRVGLGHWGGPRPAPVRSDWGACAILTPASTNVSRTESGLTRVPPSARVRQGRGYSRRRPLRVATCSRWAPWTAAHGHCVARSLPSLCARSNAGRVGPRRGDARNRKCAARAPATQARCSGPGPSRTQSRSMTFNTQTISGRLVVTRMAHARLPTPPPFFLPTRPWATAYPLA